MYCYFRSVFEKFLYHSVAEDTLFVVRLPQKNSRGTELSNKERKLQERPRDTFQTWKEMF